MNDNLQEAINQLITKTLEGVDTSVDFLQSELPEYVYQLLLWYGLYNFIVFLVSVIFLTIPLFFGRRVVKKLMATDAGTFFIGILYAICLFVLFVISLVNMNLIWLKIWIAPKVWLIEYVGGLVK